MTTIIKSGWYFLQSDGFAHYCELKEKSQLYRAKCGALLTAERLEQVDKGLHCFWCEKIRAADERKRAENEQRKIERKNARKLEKSARGDNETSLDKSPRVKLKRERVSPDRENDQAQSEPGSPEVPGVSSDTGDTGTSPDEGDERSVNDV